LEDDEGNKVSVLKEHEPDNQNNNVPVPLKRKLNDFFSIFKRNNVEVYHKTYDVPNKNEDSIGILKKNSIKNIRFY